MKKILLIFFVCMLLFSCNSHENGVKEINVTYSWETDNQLDEIKLEKEKPIEDISLEENKKVTMYDSYSDDNLTIDFWKLGYEKLKKWDILFWEYWTYWWPELIERRCYKLKIEDSDYDLSNVIYTKIVDSSNDNTHMYWVWENIVKNILFWDDFLWFYTFSRADMSESNSIDLFFSGKRYTFETNCDWKVKSTLSLVDDWVIAINNETKNYKIWGDNYNGIKNLIYYYFSLIKSWADYNSDKLFEIAYKLKYDSTQSLEEFIELYKDIKDLTVNKIDNLWVNKYKAFVEIDWKEYESVFEVIEDNKIKTISVK